MKELLLLVDKYSALKVEHKLLRQLYTNVINYNESSFTIEVTPYSSYRRDNELGIISMNKATLVTILDNLSNTKWEELCAIEKRLEQAEKGL